MEVTGRPFSRAPAIRFAVTVSLVVLACTVYITAASVQLISTTT